MRPANRTRVNNPRARRRDPFTAEKRTALEIFSVMYGRSNFLTPTEGKGTGEQSNQAHDACAALAMGKNSDGRHDEWGCKVVAAYSLRTLAQYSDIGSIGWRLTVAAVLAQSNKTGIKDSVALRTRAAVVFRDAVMTFIWPECRRSIKDQAKSVEMAEGFYRTLFNTGLGILEHRANSAAADGAAALFGSAQARTGRPALVLANEDRVITIDGSSLERVKEKINRMPQTYGLSDMEVEWLMQAIAADQRPRTLGVLRLRGSDYITGLAVPNCEKQVDSARISPNNPHP